MDMKLEDVMKRIAEQNRRASMSTVTPFIRTLLEPRQEEQEPDFKPAA